MARLVSANDYPLSNRLFLWQIAVSLGVKLAEIEDFDNAKICCERT